MAFYILINLILLTNVRSIFCAESNGQKAHFQVEDKSGDLKVTATKDLAKVTAQADSVQVVVNPGTADYPVLKSDKPVVHVSGPMCCNGGWSTYGARRKSAVPSTRQSEISRRNRQEKTPETQKSHASRANDNVAPQEVLRAKTGSRKMRLDFKASGLTAKGKESRHHKISGKFARRGHHYLKLLTRSSLKGKSQRLGELTLRSQLPESKNKISRDGETSLKSKLVRLALPSKSLKQTAPLHRTTFREQPGIKKTEVKGTGPSFHVTGNAGKLKMHVTKDATELTSESGGVDVLLKPSAASSSSGKADAQARSKQIVHLATEPGGNVDGLGIKKSILNHRAGQKRG